MNKMVPKDRLDPQVVRRIEKWERADNVRYGAGILNGEQVFVDITFYPKRRWWLCTPTSRREVEPEEARGVKEIRL